MSAQVSSVHPSLCPPRHGHPPDDGGAPPPSWVLVDLHAYVADRENATSAYSVMSNGEAIRVTFCTAPPPLVSYICVWCPNLPPTELVMEPTIEVAEDDLVHFCVSIRAYRFCCDHFVYKAPSDGKGPSLSLLEKPERYLQCRHGLALLGHREVGDIRAHVEDDGHYYLAALHHGRRPWDFSLVLYNSMDKKWSSRNFSLYRPHIHMTAKTISFGEGGLLGFVDAWRSIIIFDILGRKPEHYLPLPKHLIRLNTIHDEPLLSRDIAFVNGRLTLVEMHRNTSDQSLSCSWEVSTWSISSPWKGQDGWQMDYRFNTSSIVVDDGTANVDLLRQLRDNGATPQPALDGLLFAHPTLSLSESHIVYLMCEVSMWDKKTLVLSIDMRNPRLQGAATFDAERMMGYTYAQSRISKFFNMVPGLKGGLKRPGKFHMQDPRKHWIGIDNEPTQHSGFTQRQEDTIADGGDINMAVD